MVYTTDLTKAELRVIELFLTETYLSRRPPRWSKHQILRNILPARKWLQEGRFTSMLCNLPLVLKNGKMMEHRRMYKEVFVQSCNDQGMLTESMDCFKRKATNTKKITILCDNGYHKQKLEAL